MNNDLDFSKPEELQTVEKRNVRIFCTDGVEPFVVLGAVEEDDGRWSQVSWTKKGMVGFSQHHLQLVRKPRRVTGWVNVYKRSDVFSVLGQDVHDSRDLAKMAGRSVAQGQIYIDAEIQT